METRIKITEEERARRRDAFEFARGSCRYEGIVLSAEGVALSKRFINGEITLDEFIRQGLEAWHRDHEQLAAAASHEPVNRPPESP